MGLTLKKIPQGAWQADGSTYWDVTLDNSYPSQGYAITGRAFGLSNNLICLDVMTAVMKTCAAQGSTVYAGTYDVGTQTLRVIGSGTSAGGAGAEACLGTDLHLYSCRVRVIGY